jgi:hypothetical protein
VGTDSAFFVETDCYVAAVFFSHVAGIFTGFVHDAHFFAFRQDAELVDSSSLALLLKVGCICQKEE